MRRQSRKNIKTYLIGISVTFTLIITIIITSLVYGGFNSLLSKSLIQSTTFNLSLISESVSKNFMPVLSLSEWCKSNLQLHQYIKAANETGKATNDYRNLQNIETKKIYERSKLELRQQSLNSWKRLLEEYRANRSSIYINRLIVSSLNGDYLQHSPLSTYYSLNVYDAVTSLASFEKQFASNKIIWTGLESDPFNNFEDAQIFPIIHPVYNSYQNQVIGWSYLSISPSIVTDAFSNYDIPSDSTLLVTINSKTYQVVDNKLIDILKVPEEDRLSIETLDVTKPIQNITDSHGEKHKLVTFKSSLNGWYFSQTLSSKEFSKQRRTYFSFLVLISLVVMLLGFVLTLFLNRLINKPVSLLLRKISLISTGDFSYDPDIEWENELGDIGKGINDLSKNVEILMEKRLEDEKEKNQLEYEILQSQINPHFLYNTLNSIKWMATIQNATGIAEMTTALSKLLRSVSKDVKQIHLLTDEVKLLDHYFIIQKYRYGGALSLTYTVENHELLQCLVPKFTLQPIVENAIFHGIEPKQAAGEIHVHIYDNNSDLLYIDIHDNGVGMSEKQIHDVLNNTSDHNLDFFKKIGINNVNLRIKHSFGNEFGLNIISSNNTGTTMQIKIPKRSE